MARILLLSATPAGAETEEHLGALRDLQQRAVQDRFGVHSVTDDPHAADVILFVETYGAGWHFGEVRRHPLTRAHREKCFLFSANPYVIPFLPGIYTAIDGRWASRRTVAGFYLGLPKNEFTTYTPPSDDLPYLYSFMGSTLNAPIRQRLAEVVHPRSYFQNTAPDFARVLRRQVDARERRDYYRRYAELTKASKFVLCPRGLSVSSIRLFETMRMGRVPVILSDGWVAPPGPAWDRFSIGIPENRCADIPRILADREGEAVQMGELARQAWDEWFSDKTAFHRVVEWCLALKRERRIPERWARWPVYLQLLRPFHLRRLTREKLRALREKQPTSASASLAPAKPPVS